MQPDGPAGCVRACRYLTTLLEGAARPCGPVRGDARSAGGRLGGDTPPARRVGPSHAMRPSAALVPAPTAPPGLSQLCPLGLAPHLRRTRPHLHGDSPMWTQTGSVFALHSRPGGSESKAAAQLSWHGARLRMADAVWHMLCLVCCFAVRPSLIWKSATACGAVRSGWPSTPTVLPPNTHPASASASASALVAS